ncbi:unnamed protein product [Tilletia controversa]|uniref:Uncharacterized protein n=2 Tax=Tilletia TaxID=13289 RepID=A0A177TQE7_9BASI|nr:hypothetical protein CF335_g7493 [Tilletia laevis]KAE8262077.1 hypothetical protein A4X03_0g2741 [Tilletia caries]CAD6941092.1 unnamed protein product [Tilletia controversa]KAE8195347.1 hypothetical protein CF336_g3127 [Tilletia laevis]CAD6889364.1 unnamed protein product [Tilletia caries]
MASEVSEYEAARLANIKKNNELLQSLGLVGAGAEPLIEKPKPKPKPPTVKAKPKPRIQIEKAEDEKAEGENEAGPSRPSRRAPARRSTSSPPKYNLKELSRVAPKPPKQPRTPKVVSSSAKKELYHKPRIPGSRTSARLSHGSSSSKTYIELPDSDDSGADDIIHLRTGLAKFKGPKLDPSEDVEGTGAYEEYERQPLPTRAGPAGPSGQGKLIFEDRWKLFTPNLSPQEMMEGGMFGGTAFRRHYSTVKRTWLEPNEELAALPQDWLKNIDIKSKLTRDDYDPTINRFGVKASQSLADWEQAGWVRSWDPRGCWGWYIAFYLGRRCSDDACQISRWLKAVGPAGRFKRGLIRDVAASHSKMYDDESIARILRQTCWHWAVELTQEDYQEAVSSF